METAFVILFGLPNVLLLALLARALYIIYGIYSDKCKLNTHKKSLSTILCIGSGGHTAELLKLMQYMDVEKYQPRLYIVADNDVNSEAKILKQEAENSKYLLSRIPRSRNVNESYLSAVFNTLRATLHTIPIVYKFKPDVIFCNGPGTCVPVCFVAFLLRCLFVLDCRIVFVESICRVRTLSLTGKILQFFADVVVVQWPQLREVCFRAKYFGRLT